MNVQETVNMQTQALQRALQVCPKADERFLCSFIASFVMKQSHVALLFMQNGRFELYPHYTCVLSFVYNTIEVWEFK